MRLKWNKIEIVIEVNGRKMPLYLYSPRIDGVTWGDAVGLILFCSFFALVSLEFYSYAVVIHLIGWVIYALTIRHFIEEIKKDGDYRSQWEDAMFFIGDQILVEVLLIVIASCLWQIMFILLLFIDG